MNQFLIKLKIISHYRILFLILVTGIYVIYNINNTVKSLYSSNDNSIRGVIDNIFIENNKVQIELIGKERILINYYIKEDSNQLINYDLGDIIEVHGEISLPKTNTNFNLFNYKNYLMSKKFYTTFLADELNKISSNENIFYKIKNYLIKRISKFKSKRYLHAFILGNNKYIDESVLNSYQKNGISHLFAISGMHVTFLTAILMLIMNKLSKNDIVNQIIIIILLLFYSFLTNFSPSILRAVIFFVLLFIKNQKSLKISNFDLFLIMACLFLIYNPYYIYHTGFLFSFTISGFLIFYQSWLGSSKGYIKSLLKTSLVAFLASIPILINNSFEINFLTPILNLFFVPFVSIIIFPLSFLVMICPLFEPIYLFLISILENLSLLLSKINILTFIFAIPHIIILIIYYILIVICLNRMRKQKYKVVILFLITLIIHNNIHIINIYPVMTMLDVGQGDSILIELPFNKGNILIDTGGIMSFGNTKSDYSIAKSITIPYLKSIGIKKLDYLIITHGDFDHIGEAKNLIGNFSVGDVIMNSGNNNYLENELIHNLNSNKIKYYSYNKRELNINGYNFKFINNKNINNENEDSLVVYTVLNNKKIMLMGDAGHYSENNILKEYNLEKVDILKVGHHGSRYSSSKEFVDQINPDISLISVGINNRFNHPHEESINNLNSVNSNIYQTSINGSIKIVLKDNMEIYPLVR